MSGDIAFLQRWWMSSGGAVHYVMEFLASRVRDTAATERLTELVAANVAFLDLGDPECAELVDLVADELPLHVAGLEDAQLRSSLTRTFADLIRYAKEQQDYNRNPTQDTCYTVGPHPARHFDLDRLMSIALRQLNKTDFVRIDVSDYTPEQRTLVRDHVAELANPRVLVAAEDDRDPP